MAGSSNAERIVWTATCLLIGLTYDVIDIVLIIVLGSVLETGRLVTVKFNIYFGWQWRQCSIYELLPHKEYALCSVIHTFFSEGNASRAIEFVYKYYCREVWLKEHMLDDTCEKCATSRYGDITLIL